VALFARENELESVCALLAPPRIGGALVLRGKAGVGKSALLNEVISAGKRAGVRILSTAGVSSQMQQPFAGLSHLMRSVLTDPTLPDGYADAWDTVRAAIGGQDVPIGNPFSVAYAVLELTAGPILLARPGRSCLPGRATVSTLADFLKTIIGPIILVGHSYDGMVRRYPMFPGLARPF
jgi:hypothetical protein